MIAWSLKDCGKSKPKNVLHPALQHECVQDREEALPPNESTAIAARGERILGMLLTMMKGGWANEGVEGECKRVVMETFRVG